MIINILLLYFYYEYIFIIYAGRNTPENILDDFVGEKKSAPPARPSKPPSRPPPPKTGGTAGNDLLTGSPPPPSHGAMLVRVTIQEFIARVKFIHLILPHNTCYNQEVRIILLIL